MRFGIARAYAGHMERRIAGLETNEPVLGSKPQRRQHVFPPCFFLVGEPEDGSRLVEETMFVSAVERGEKRQLSWPVAGVMVKGGKGSALHNPNAAFDHLEQLAVARIGADEKTGRSLFGPHYQPPRHVDVHRQGEFAKSGAPDVGDADPPERLDKPKDDGGGPSYRFGD